MFLELSVIGLGMGVSYFLNEARLLAIPMGWFSGGRISPDFLLLYVIFFSLFRGDFAGIWIGFFAGLLEDQLIYHITGGGEVVSMLGIHTLIYPIVGYTLGRVNRFFDSYNMAPVVLLVLGTTIVVRFFVWSLQGVMAEFNLSYSILGPALFTGFFSPIWFAVLSWLFRISMGDDT